MRLNRSSFALWTLVWTLYMMYTATQVDIPWERLFQGTFVWTWGIRLRMALLLVMWLAGLVLLLWPPARWWPTWARWRARFGRARYALAAAALTALLFSLLWAPGLSWPVPRWMYTPHLFFPVALLGVGLWIWPDAGPTWEHALATWLVMLSALAWLDPYTEVSAYPFSQTWSEGNRLWDYSVLFGRERYDYPLDRPIPTLTDKGRIFLWGLPFLLPNANILVLRLWNAVLFTVPHLVLAAVALAPQGLPRRRWLWAALWGFVFLVQGPIYTPLVLSALLVVWAEGHGNVLWAALGVALAAFYAEETRFTWIFAPAMWAGMLALGRWPAQGRPRLTWWTRPIALVMAGLLGGLVVPLALRRPHALTLLPQQAQARVQQHPLLWERLWPNPTFPPGLLLAVLLATGPVLAFLAWCWRRGYWRAHPWAVRAATLALLAFFGVGTLVSVKIGGGNNLHNYDMYLIGVLLITAMAWRNGLARAYARGWRERTAILWGMALLAGPTYFITLYLSPWEPPPRHTPQVLARVQQAVAQAAAQGGEVLFLDQRQLLTFGLVPRVPLVPEYEKKRLMNEAMADNAAYFAQYYADLARQRFALIVSEPLKNRKAIGVETFSAEQNAWNSWVSRPTLCYYEPIFTDTATGVQLLIPRQPPPDCRPVLPVPPAKPSSQEPNP